MSGTYLAIMCEVAVAVGCIFPDICKNVGCVCNISMVVVSLTFVIWQQYLFTDICQICVKCHLTRGLI